MLIVLYTECIDKYFVIFNIFNDYKKLLLNYYLKSNITFLKYATM